MAFAFDGQSFGQVLQDAERLAARARDFEERLVTIVNLFEEHGRTELATSDLLGAVRGVCIDARDHRLLAEAHLAHLVGEIAPRNGSGKGRVLVVDDTQDNLDVVTMVLEAAGFEAITARDGLEAVIVAHYARPSLILMDVTMPVLNGLEAARLLKASAVTQGVNVVAYTAKPDFLEPPFTKFFVDVVKKPASPQAILASVNQFVAPYPTE
jgi:CheY-like chemotaxis protein